MDSSALDDIHRFTQSVNQPDLYAYLGIEKSSDKSAITRALQVRRSWAQGQQANPKFRQEALWLIKNINLVKTALTTESQRYLKDIAIRDERTKLETLSMFIKGTIADGELTARGEEAIQKQAAEMGLPESLVIRRIGEILAERDAEKMAEKSESVAEQHPLNFDLSHLTDLYDILDTPPDSDLAALEAAYRRRYRWARQLRDTEQSSRIYAQIDEAWRVLKDPEKRAAYDAERVQTTASPSEDTESPKKGFLPPPPPTQGIALPMPSVEQHLERVHAIESGELVAEQAAPVIAMPTATPEREAPPPPTIPMPGEPGDSGVDDLNEDPEVSFADLSSEDGSGHFDSPVALESDDAIIPSPTSQEDNSLPFPSMNELDSQTDSEPADGDEDPFELMRLYASKRSSSDEEDSNPSIMMSFDLEDDDDQAAPTDFMSFDDFGDETKGEAQAEPLWGEGQMEPSGIDDGLNVGADTSMAEDRPQGPNRTTGPSLSAGQIFNEFAVLKIDGPRVIRIRTGAHPFPVRITVRNDGEGAMPGTVSANVPWIQLSPKVLDPDRHSQVIEALVEPDGIASNSGKAVVTVETDHGETRTVTIDVLKHIVSPVTMFVAALSLVGVVGLFAGLYLSGVIGSDLKTPTRTILAINVDPNAGEVYINDELVGKQGTLSLIDAFPIDEEFQIRVELDGFEPFIRDLKVSKGTQYRVEADLELRDLVDYQPPPGAIESELDTTALDAILERREKDLEACFTRNFPTTEPFQAEITINAIVTTRGFIQGITFSDANFKSPQVETCLRRQLRSLHLPLLADDYARFTRTIGTEIRPATAINERGLP